MVSPRRERSGKPTPLFPRLELGGRGGNGVRLIDSHCHLNYDGLIERQDEVLENARERGVAGFLNISTRQQEWDDIIAVADREHDVWASIGVHPHEADAHPDLGSAALVEAANHPRVIAIGECGLDYFYDKSDRSAQRERFQAHVEAARQTGCPWSSIRARLRRILPRSSTTLSRKAASPASFTASPARPSLRGKASTSASMSRCRGS